MARYVKKTGFPGDKQVCVRDDDLGLVSVMSVSAFDAVCSSSGWDKRDEDIVDKFLGRVLEEVGE